MKNLYDRLVVGRSYLGAVISGDCDAKKHKKQIKEVFKAIEEAEKIIKKICEKAAFDSRPRLPCDID